MQIVLACALSMCFLFAPLLHGMKGAGRCGVACMGTRLSMNLPRSPLLTALQTRSVHEGLSFLSAKQDKPPNLDLKRPQWVVKQETILAKLIAREKELEKESRPLTTKQIAGAFAIRMTGYNILIPAALFFGDVLLSSNALPFSEFTFFYTNFLITSKALIVEGGISIATITGVVEKIQKRKGSLQTNNEELSKIKSGIAYLTKELEYFSKK